MSRSDTRALLTLARPQRGERARLALSVALAAAAAAAAIGLLATSGYLISRAAQRPPILMLMVAIVGVRAFGITRAALRYGERLASHDLALRQLARLRVRFYQGLAPLVPGGLNARSGDLLSRFVADVDTLKDVYLRVVIPGLVSMLVIAGAALVAAIVLPAAGLTVLASLTLAAVLLPWLSAAAVARAARRQAPARARLTSELVESIDGANELALAGRAGEYVRRLRRSDAALARIARGDALAVSGAQAAGGLLAAAGMLALLLVAIPAVHAGALSGVLLAALVFLLLAAYDSVLALPASARGLRMCATAAGRLREITLARPAVADPVSPRTLTGVGPLCAEGVGFRYAPGLPWALEHVELRIEPGEHVALTGASGAGKSTLAELLVRFHDPQRGRVTIDGVDLRELPQEQIRSAVLLCGQDCHVFNTSIRENLLLARRGASERDVLAALAAVELDEWAGGLPQGLDTLVGRDGELMSGGQRRRLALARALLADSRFLILDEPTAHLDVALAARVMHNVLSVCDDRGVLVITHDTTALEGFDRVLSV
ncbi:MAG: thiol reductant ABC exporter subunit CydC [Solirubrobacteraceae bacterium]